MTVPVPLPGVQSRTLQTDRLAIHGLLAGDEGMPVVCLHGHLATSAFFEELLLTLPAGYRGIAIDLRAHGGTEASTIDARVGCDDLVADVRAYLDALGVGRHHVLAHGVGAAVLWRYLLRFSDDVVSATAVNPAPPCGYGGTRDAAGTATGKHGWPAGAGLMDPDLLRRLADQDVSVEGRGAPAAVLSRHLGRDVPRQDVLLTAMLGIVVDDSVFPGDTKPLDVWPYHRPGERGLLNAVSARWYRGEAVLHADNRPPLLWVRGSDDPVVSDAGEEDAAVMGHAGMLPGWPGASTCPPQPMLAQMRRFLEQYKRDGSHAKEVVVPGAHLPWISHPQAFQDAWHSWLLTPSTRG